MRAFLSGPNRYGTANDYCRHIAAEQEAPALRQHASATEAWEQVKARLALREAGHVLALTRPSGIDNAGFGECYWSGRQALAEALTRLDSMSIDELVEIQEHEVNS